MRRPKGETGEPDVADTVIGAMPTRPALPALPDDDTLVPPASRAPFPLVEPDTGRRSSPGEQPTSQAMADEVVATEWEPEPRPRGHRVHAIHIGNHEAIPLDAPALIGRRPSSPRIAGNVHPKLIRVPSPTREISSTHVEIRQEGSAVVVTDLDSTNGTLIAVPGFPSRKLRQGESVAVTPGTVVELGDGIAIRILPLPGVSP
ncbi:MAG: FHA domain-containing protein [Terrimesophilobacter sp.]